MSQETLHPVVGGRDGVEFSSEDRGRGRNKEKGVEPRGCLLGRREAPPAGWSSRH